MRVIRHFRLAMVLADMHIHYRSAWGVHVDLLARHGIVSITRLLVVDPAQRGKGLASHVLADICMWADFRGLTLGITPDGRYGADLGRLRGFYMSMGFRTEPEIAAGLGVPDEMLRMPIDPKTDGLLKGLELWREVKRMQRKDYWHPRATPLATQPDGDDESAETESESS